MVADDQLDAFEEIVSENDLYEALLAVNWRIPGELLCGHSSRTYATNLRSLSEYAGEQGIEDIDLEGDAPEGTCSYCWSKIYGLS